MKRATPVLCLLMACTRAPSPEGQRAASVALPDAAVETRALTADAGVEDPIVDLLHTVESTVAVSSKVDNPRDFPEHLVDGKPDTAWNGRTGDLKGFIAFRVPKVARVLRVELTVGFDKAGKDGDLFTQNHRITKVRLSREGKALKEAALDPEVRGLQAIALDEPGGDFRVDVLETKPGTKAAWKELVVSEFRVWGRAGGAPEKRSHIPTMAIGSLDGVPPALAVVPGAPPLSALTMDALCKDYDRAMAPSIKAAHPPDRYPGSVDPPHCRPLHHPVKLPTSWSPFKSGRFMIFDSVDDESALLVLETERGFTRTSVVLWSRDHADPGCAHGSAQVVEDAQTMKTSGGQEVLVLRLVTQDTQWAQMDPSQDGIRTTELAYACRLDAAGVPRCDAPLVLGRAKEPMRKGMIEGTKGAWDIPMDRIPWVFRKTVSLGPAGDLRAL